MTPIILGCLTAILVLLAGLYTIGTRRQRQFLAVLMICGIVGGLRLLYDLNQPQGDHATTQVTEQAALPGESYNARLPQPNREAGYVSADSCQACHADQYASWHSTYHRTMT